MFTDKAELANRSPPNLPENIAKIVVLFTYKWFHMPIQCSECNKL